MIRKYLLLPALYLLLPLLVVIIAIYLLLGQKADKQFDDPEFWRSATAEDMKSVMDDWRGRDRTDGEFTPLHYAVPHSARPELVRELLGHEADVNARYDNRYSRWNGWTPLHLTAFVQGNHRWIFEVIEPLLSRGADIEARDVKGATPLHLAALYGNAPAAATLLKRGADIHARAGGEEFDNYDYYIGTPLHLAVRQSESLYNDPNPLRDTLPDWYPIVLEHKPEVVETLLAHGARTDLEDEHGLTPLHRAVQVEIDEDSPHTEVKRRAAREAAELLLKGGAEVNAHPKEGYWTSLHAALGSDAGVEVVTLLLSHGADVEIGNESALYSASHSYASSDDGFEVIKLLLDRGAAQYVNTCTMTRGGVNYSPFMIALDDATLEVVDLFIKHGASVDAGCEAELPLDRWGLNRDGGRTETFEILPIHRAARNPDPRITQLLLEQGANPNAEGAYYETPLFSAANHEVAEVLLQYGANTEASNIAGETPLLSEAAFGGGDRALIEDLLKYGADVSTHSNGGYNALHYLAGWEPDPAIVELFLDRGVDPSERADNGETPCHIARDNAEGDDDYPEELLKLFCG